MTFYKIMQNAIEPIGQIMAAACDFQQMVPAKPLSIAANPSLEKRDAY
jgi:hypothetical protein